MSKIKRRNLSLCGILILISLCVALFATLNGTGINASAASEISLDSIIFTDSAAFQFTPITGTECSVKLIDKTQKNVRVPKTATIDGVQYSITEVASNGFSSTQTLKTVIMPYITKSIV